MKEFFVTDSKGGSPIDHTAVESIVTSHVRGQVEGNDNSDRGVLDRIALECKNLLREELDAASPDQDQNEETTMGDLVRASLWQKWSAGLGIEPPSARFAKYEEILTEEEDEELWVSCGVDVTNARMDAEAEEEREFADYDDSLDDLEDWEDRYTSDDEDEN